MDVGVDVGVDTPNHYKYLCLCVFFNNYSFSLVIKHHECVVSFYTSVLM